MHTIMIPYDMIRVQRLERAAHMIIIFIAINNNHTDWYIIIYIQ